jgi:hypothetical protein
VVVVLLTFAMALLRVGFGAVFFAPNNRFMLAVVVDYVCDMWMDEAEQCGGRNNCSYADAYLH